MDRVDPARRGSRAGTASPTAGSSATILDEVMAWSLVGRRQLGRDRADGDRLQAPGRHRPADPRGGVDHPHATPHHRHRGPPPRRRDRRGPGHVDRRLRRRRRGAQAPAPGAIRLGATWRRRSTRRHAGGAVRTPGGTARRADDGRDRAEPRDRPCRRLRRGPPRAGRALGAELAELVNDPDAFAARLDAGLRALADPDVPRRPARRRARASARSTASAGRSWPRSRAAFRRATRRDRPTTLLFLADRLLREPDLGAALVRLRPPRAHARRRDRADLAAPAPRRPRGRRLDHRRQPGPRRTRRRPAEPYRWAELEQLVYSPSRWERRLVGSTIATMTHGSRGKRLGPTIVAHAAADPRPAHGRRRARRPEGARLGLSLAGRHRSRGRDGRAPSARPTRAVDGRRRQPRLGHPRHARQARPGGRRRPAHAASTGSADAGDAAPTSAAAAVAAASDRCPTRPPSRTPAVT